jgi:hypothetical protein
MLDDIRIAWMKFFPSAAAFVFTWAALLLSQPAAVPERQFHLMRTMSAWA